MVGNVLCGIIFVPKDGASRQHLCCIEVEAVETRMDRSLVLHYKLKKVFRPGGVGKSAGVDVFFSGKGKTYGSYV